MDKINAILGATIVGGGKKKTMRRKQFGGPATGPQNLPINMGIMGNQQSATPANLSSVQSRAQSLPKPVSGQVSGQVSGPVSGPVSPTMEAQLASLQRLQAASVKPLSSVLGSKTQNASQFASKPQSKQLYSCTIPIPLLCHKDGCNPLPSYKKPVCKLNDQFNSSGDFDANGAFQSLTGFGGGMKVSAYKKYLENLTVERLHKIAKSKGVKITKKSGGKTVYVKKATIVKKLCEGKYGKK